MMKKSDYKERVKQVDTYINKNKLYIGIIIIVLILLLTNVFGFKENNAEKNTSDHIDSSSTVDNENETAKNKPHWSFYWSDLIILVVGGGFCCFKIIQQHRKEREKL